MIAARNPWAIKAFVACGGRFTDQQNDKGISAAMYAAGKGPESIKVFIDNGGTFTDQIDYRGWTAATYAVLGGPEAVRSYEAAVARQGGLRHVEARPVTVGGPNSGTQKFAEPS